MEISRENFRAMIFYDFKCGLTLHSAFGDEVPSKTTVYDWFSEFMRGRVSLSNEFREGRPSTAVVPANIDAVREMVEADRHVTFREIEATMGIGKSQIQTILYEHLGVKKICTRVGSHII